MFSTKPLALCFHAAMDLGIGRPTSTYSTQNHVQTDVKPPDDKAFFRELEAIYLLRLLLLSCTTSLESCAYELQDASAVLTAKLQSMPHIGPPSPVLMPTHDWAAADSVQTKTHLVNY